MNLVCEESSTSCRDNLLIIDCGYSTSCRNNLLLIDCGLNKNTFDMLTLFIWLDCIIINFNRLQECVTKVYLTVWQKSVDNESELYNNMSLLI
jgi:hypothetical protein